MQTNLVPPLPWWSSDLLHTCPSQELCLEAASFGVSCEQQPPFNSAAVAGLSRLLRLELVRFGLL